MCLFDVVIALDIKKIEENDYFYIFLVFHYFPLFSSILPRRYIPDPHRYFHRYTICNYAFKFMETLDLLTAYQAQIKYLILF